ncbi:hypothetical protein RRG08_041052 [Elysia crispata]|uniref:Uncharacterized protein n=1 Tax=Elysia crispata TaxID=231223 RepID=A0AAE1CU51_9GAST|nr:hypothetical protein RRG08_041052 [Elysia crispata]
MSLTSLVEDVREQMATDGKWTQLTSVSGVQIMISSQGNSFRPMSSEVLLRHPTLRISGLSQKRTSVLRNQKTTNMRSRLHFAQTTYVYSVTLASPEQTNL